MFESIIVVGSGREQLLPSMKLENIFLR